MATELVIVADDDPDIRSLIDLRLRRAGHRVLAAANGRDALDLALAHEPALLLLDVEMPLLGGHDVCRVVREQLEVAPAIIFISARTRTEDRIAGLDLGAVDYITKPFSAAELDARVRAALRTHAGMTQLVQHARTDHPTGLLNRRSFDETLRRTRRAGAVGDVGVILVDVDNFKSINDTRGHATGDDVLIEVARRITACSRGSVFRLGGDEFAVVGDARALADDLAARIVEAIGASPIAGLAVTASAGSATARAEAAADVVALADAALYRAKAAGRNRAESA